ncbi:MAG: biotin--[acetyl-CoA-carboxylase] ligase [Balneolaceae bacterium]
MFVTSDYKKKLNTQWLGSEFRYLEQTESTNSLLKSVPAEELAHGTVLLADRQLKGRGQYNRNWLSEPFKNLTFTIALKPARSDTLSLLALAAGWGIVRALQTVYGNRFYLKWPNDVMISGKKLGGILVESVFNGSSLDRVLVGIGLNTGQMNFPKELPHATSLAHEFGNPPAREEILCRILEYIEVAYRKWQRSDVQLIHDINDSMAGFGDWVRITVNGEASPEKVKFLGVNPEGHLVILTPEIEVKKFIHEQIRIFPDHPPGGKLP